MVFYSNAANYLIIEFSLYLSYYSLNKNLISVHLLMYLILQEMKELKESVSKSYVDQLQELHHVLEVRQKGLVEANRILAEQKHAMSDLNERLNASMQSCAETNEIMTR